MDTHVVCADIVRIEACCHDADGKDVVILMQVGHAGQPVCGVGYEEGEERVSVGQQMALLYRWEPCSVGFLGLLPSIVQQCAATGPTLACPF